MQNETNPLFSIIIPTYNRAQFITKAIKSVIDQQYNSWELIIIDDGSTDNTKEVVDSINDRRIFYYYQENQERSVARNYGVTKAIGDYVCFLDSDDWYLPDHLIELRKFIIAKSYPKALLYTGLYFYTDKGFKSRPLSDHIPENFVEHALFYTIYPTSACLHKDIFKQYSFRTDLIPTEDRALWMQIASSYPIMQVNKNTCVVNIHDNSSTQLYSQSFTLRNADDELKILSRVFHYDNVKKHLTKKSIKKYTSRYYYYYLYDSLDRGKTSYVIFFFLKYLYHYPTNIFRMNTYVTLLEMVKRLVSQKLIKSKL